MSREDCNATTRRVAYSLAAGAAAGMAGTADAAVSYSGPQNINIGQFGFQDLNLDGDGFTDIRLKNYVFSSNYQGASVLGFPGQLVLSNASFPFYVTSLTNGDLIDSAAVGPNFQGSLAFGASNPNAEFNNATGALLGLSFPIGANDLAHTHYGWVRVTINNAAGTFVINDWAYNTVAGESIRAGEVPEPTTLGLLAAGAAGVAAMRRRQAA